MRTLVMGFIVSLITIFAAPSASAQSHPTDFLGPLLRGGTDAAGAIFGPWRVQNASRDHSFYNLPGKYGSTTGGSYRIGGYGVNVNSSPYATGVGFWGKDVPGLGKVRLNRNFQQPPIARPISSNKVPREVSSGFAAEYAQNPSKYPPGTELVVPGGIVFVTAQGTWDGPWNNDYMLTRKRNQYAALQVASVPASAATSAAPTSGPLPVGSEIVNGDGSISFVRANGTLDGPYKSHAMLKRKRAHYAALSVPQVPTTAPTAATSAAPAASAPLPVGSEIVNGDGSVSFVRANGTLDGPYKSHAMLKRKRAHYAALSAKQAPTTTAAPAASAPAPTSSATPANGTVETLPSGIKIRWENGVPVPVK